MITIHSREGLLGTAECASSGYVRGKWSRWRTSELAGEMGVVGFGGGDVGAQEVWRQPFWALSRRGCAALLVHRQHVRRQPSVLDPAKQIRVIG